MAIRPTSMKHITSRNSNRLIIDSIESLLLLKNEAVQLVNEFVDWSSNRLRTADHPNKASAFRNVKTESMVRRGDEMCGGVNS